MISTAEYRDLATQVELLYATYCEALDDGDVGRWPDFFADQAHYRITTRENLERGMALSFVLCDGLPMLRDRAAGLKEAVFFRPRHQRRILSGLRLTSFDDPDGKGIDTVVSFVVYESVNNGPSRLLACGRSSDVVVREGGVFKFRRRMCVIDAGEMPDSLVFPI